MKDLKTYVLETKKISSIDDYVLEGFRLGKNKVKKEEDNFVDLDLPSSTLWCKYNVGATCEDDAKSWYGDYFMWGDPESATSKPCNFTNYKHSNGAIDKLTKYCPSNKINCWDGKGKPDNKSVLDEEDDMANINMDGDWKIPTKEQCQELIDNTTNKWVENYNDISGLKGILFTSKTNGNILFIPAAGCRHGSYVDHEGLDISVWSSSCGVVRPAYAYYLYSNSASTYIQRNIRSYGCSVRGVMN